MNQRGRSRVVGLAVLAVLASVALALALHAGPSATLTTVAIRTAPSAVAVDDRAVRAVVISVADKTVGVLDTTSGQLVRTVTIGAGPRTVAVDAATRRASVLNSNGTASVLDTASGAVVRTVALGMGSTGMDIGPLVVDERSGRVYVIVRSPAGRAGHVAVLDAATDTVLRTIPVGLDPRDVAVDARVERVVVVNAGGGSPGLAPAPPWAAWPRRLHGWFPVVPAPTPPPPGRGTGTVFDTMR